MSAAVEKKDDEVPLDRMDRPEEVLNPGSVKTIDWRLKKILVTGGCGFIGSHLIDVLMKDPRNKVICLDNCFSGDESNIDHWKGHPRFTFIYADVIEPINIPVDEIYHLACPASPVFYQDDGLRTMDVAYLGAKNVLKLAKKYDAKVLLASTSECYGDPLVHPQVEEYWGNVNPIGVRSCYDESKRVSEALFDMFHRQYKTKIRIARIFNTYGPRMLENDGRVVSNFIRQCLDGKSLTVYGDGKQTRSFCYIDDMVTALIAMMEANVIGPINLGNPSEYTILELAESVQKLVNPDSEISFGPLPSDDPKRRCPDITKAKKFLSWEPKVPLQEGLQKTVESFRARRKRFNDAMKKAEDLKQ